MEAAIRTLVDAPLLQLASSVRRWSYLRTSVPRLLLEYRIQGWCRVAVGIFACFLVSRATSDGFFAGGLFFLWILGVYALSVLAARTVPNRWTGEDYDLAMREAAARKTDKLVERLSSLAMVAASVALLVFLVGLGETVGAAIAGGMMGLALAETFRCYIRAAEPPHPSLRASFNLACPGAIIGG